MYAHMYWLLTPDYVPQQILMRDYDLNNIHIYPVISDNGI